MKRSRAFSERILTPLQNLIGATQALKGNLAISQMEHANIHEIDTLIDNFTLMNETLQELYESMERKN